MKTLKSLIIIAVSMVFVVGLCSQAWAKKQAGPTPGKMSASDLKQYKMIKAINASRLYITPKVVDPGDTLSFRGTIVFSADLVDKINENEDDPDDYLEPGDNQFVLVVLIGTDGELSSTGVWQLATYPRSVTIHFPQKYVVPTSAQPGHVLNFGLTVGWPPVIVAENSVEVRTSRKPKLRDREMRPDIEQQRAIDPKPTIKEQK